MKKCTHISFSLSFHLIFKEIITKINKSNQIIFIQMFYFQFLVNLFFGTSGQKKQGEQTSFAKILFTFKVAVSHFITRDVLLD